MSRNRFYLSKVKKLHFFIKHLLVLSFNWLPGFTLKNAFLRLLGMKVGRRSYLLRNLDFHRPGNIVIGNNSVINRDVMLDNRNLIRIGNSVSIGKGTQIFTGGHDIESSSFDYISRPVEIGDRAVLFANVMVMPGVKIGNNAVVMAGSVVTKDIPENTVFGGNPARFIRKTSRSPTVEFDYPYWYSK